MAGLWFCSLPTAPRAAPDRRNTVITLSKRKCSCANNFYFHDYFLDNVTKQCVKLDVGNLRLLGSYLGHLEEKEQFRYMETLQYAVMNDVVCSCTHRSHTTSSLTVGTIVLLKGRRVYHHVW